MDIHPRLDHHPGSDLSAEEPEEAAFERRRPRERGQEEGDLQQIPDRLDEKRPAAVETIGRVEEIISEPGH